VDQELDEIVSILNDLEQIVCLTTDGYDPDDVRNPILIRVEKCARQCILRIRSLQETQAYSIDEFVGKLED